MYLLVNTAVVVAIRLEAFYFYSNPNSLATDMGTMVFRDGKISCYLRAKGEKSKAVCRQKPPSESRRGKAKLGKEGGASQVVTKGLRCPNAAQHGGEAR